MLNDEVEQGLCRECNKKQDEEEKGGEEGKQSHQPMMFGRITFKESEGNAMKDHEMKVTETIRTEVIQNNVREDGEEEAVIDMPMIEEDSD